MGILLAVGFAAQKEVVVSSAGLDSNPGTERLPMATISSARDRARELGIHSVVVHAGRYALKDSVAFDEHDSGLVLRAAHGERPVITGGIEIPQASIHRCTDAAVLDRIIDEGAHRLVREVDLSKLGLAKMDAIQPRGFPHSGSSAPNELFQGAQAMTLARWPNTGFAKVGKVTEPGNGEHDHDKPARQPVFSIGERATHWVQAEDLWMYAIGNSTGRTKAFGSTTLTL